MNQIRSFSGAGYEIVDRPVGPGGSYDSSPVGATPHEPSHYPRLHATLKATPAVILENLTKKYKSFYAVDDVSFFVPEGTIVGLIGANGAGKTTTIAMIMGLLIPSYGSVRVLGHDMTRARHKVLKRMNFQSPYVAMPAQLTVRQNLNVFGRLYGVPDLKARIGELTDEFGLGELLNLETGRLSAGQKTRVSLAKALINKPAVLVLDEPTASLDLDRAEWLRGRLQAYRSQHQSTILLSSHNMLEVEQLCDYVAIMSSGRLIEIGTPAELLRWYQCGRLEEVFLYISRCGPRLEPTAPYDAAVQLSGRRPPRDEPPLDAD